MGYIVQEGNDCIVHLKGVIRTVKGSAIVKLASTIWDSPGSKYTEEEMRKFGFVLKERL